MSSGWQAEQWREYDWDKPLPPGSPEHLMTVFRRPVFSGERREG